MTQAMLRMLIAMYLAIWSPAVCCCAIKTAMGAVTGVEVARCDQQSPARDAQADEGCCASREGSRDDAEAATSDDEPSPCRCHETVESKVRLDTGAKVTLPALEKIDALPAMLWAVIRVAMMPSVAEGVVGDHHVSAVRPQASLLAQRCLLLI
jgi:hypothetical protein